VIFRRHRADTPDEADLDEVGLEDELEDEADEADDEFEDEWAELDQREDWRADGPFDVDEVDFDADDIERVDLGALIVTPESGFKIQLVVDQKTKTADTLIVATDRSQLQVTVLAAPGSPGFATEWRERIVEETRAGGGEARNATGPFGTELHRIAQGQDPEGKATRTPVRDWLVQGPRWLLHARLLGAACLDSGKDQAAELEEFFRNLIVRRGDTALVPGAPVALRPPEPR
jgi:hypothetical protein